MLGCDKSIARIALLQTRQHVEDTATTIIDKQDTQTTIEILIPQRILVVEETKVAYDAVDILISDDREACCCRK